MSQQPSIGDFQVLQKRVEALEKWRELVELGDVEEDPDARRNARHAVERKTKPNAPGR
jgi:hypothetical protein